MAIEILIVGTAPDDNTGESLRSGAQKINANFDYVQGQLDLKATIETLDAALLDVAESIADVNDALDGKQDIGGPDPGIDYPRTDAAQVLTIVERRQVVGNQGAWVTLPFELVPVGTDVDGTNTYDLPIFPANFIIDSIFLTLHKRTVGSSGTLIIGYTLDQGASAIAGNAGTGITGTGSTGGTVGAPNRRLSKELETTVTVTVLNTEVAGVAKGATLWLRGIWET